ncbi:hypothetical protein RhiirC2_812737 [Rhizophagus irregularis]|uniref:Uncharacterized protein n=1 Tax=Rhizophagus irregularis TaxID=588596 RepID=A0A2N1NSF4_9GLOM|nr:hypothetical protein RhiirC2_812737 [Rhizophagus irregularis]
MDESSSQSGSSSYNTVFALGNLEIDNSVSYKQALHVKTSRHSILLKLEENGFITPDEKAKELIKELTGMKYLFNLKLLFENLQNEFTNQILIDTLVALADPAPFNLYYSKESAARLELHLRTLIAVLERICFSPIRLTKDLRDKIYNSLTRFAEIHRKTTQVIEEGLENNFRSNYDQFKQQKDDKSDEKIAKKRNYNIDFLLIHLRDTLHSLRDDETWFQEIIRRIRDLLKTALNITPGILSAITGANLPNDCSILSMLNQVRQSLSFKYPVASYYIDWRIMLIIQHNLVIWSEHSEMIISKKFGELIFMEYLWSFLEREWINIANKSILDSQTKFDEVSNKVIKALNNTGSFLNDLSGNEPLALPYTLWFGILDLAHNLIQKSTRKSIHGLCYYLAIESLNKAPSSFIQFKAIEILLHLHNIDNQIFSIIDDDFDHYMQILNENNSLDSEKFQKLLEFVKDKCLEDLNIIYDDIEKEKKGKGKGKSTNQNSYIIREQTTNSTILDAIANEITCPISSEPTDQLCILKCKHALSLNNLKMLKQKICPQCRKKINDDDIRYLPQTSIYNNLYSKFSKSGYISPSIELENSDQIQCDSDDSDNSEIDLILTKKKFKNPFIKLNSSLLSIVPRFTKKQSPTYRNIIKELNEKHYEKAESLCKEFLNFFPKSYSLRCILAYIYKCLNNYEHAHLYSEEAIKLKPKGPIAYFICGEIYFRQNEYVEAVKNLKISLNCKAKINNIYIILGNIYLYYNVYDSYYHFNNALEYYETAMKNDPNNYLCLKNCAYIYENKKKDYQNALLFLDKLLSINKKYSLILCYYGEILFKMGKYNNAISYFTEANIIDPENIHNLKKRAITYYNLREYDKVLSDLDKVNQFDSKNILAYYHKSLTYFTKNDISNANLELNKLTELLNSNNNIIEKTQLFHLEYLLNKNKIFFELENILTKINQISNIGNSETLLFIRCNIYIELGMYPEAELDLNFWSYLVQCRIELEYLGIIDCYNTYLYKDFYGRSIIWKINVKKIISKDCFIKFTEIDTNYITKRNEHTLKYKDILKFEGLGWIEYSLPIKISLWNSQLSIEISAIDMKIDYIRFGHNEEEITHISNMSYLLPGYHEFYQSIPDVFKDKYFSKKEVEEVFELKDILDSL